MDSCEGSLQTISWKTISWYQYKHNCRWQMTSWNSHRRWEVSGRILQREESRMEKRIRSTSKNNIIRTSNSLLCFFTGDKHKFTYFVCAIKQMNKYIQAIDDVIQSKLIPAITGGHICSEVERMLLFLLCHCRGLGIPILKEIAPLKLNIL